jgi:hypothetical protein
MMARFCVRVSGRPPARRRTFKLLRDLLGQSESLRVRLQVTFKAMQSEYGFHGGFHGGFK